MNYQSVTSSNISEIGHEDETLSVRFKNGTEYHYSNVPKGIFAQLVEAASVGRTFNELIKRKPSDYPYRQVA